MKYVDILGLLEASNITDEQDRAAFGMFVSMVIRYQKMMGISDEKMIRFSTVVIDFIQLSSEAEKK